MTSNIYNHPERFELTTGRVLWSVDGEIVPVCRNLGAAAGVGVNSVDDAIDPTVELLVGDFDDDTIETAFERTQRTYDGTDARLQPFSGYDRKPLDYL